MQSSTRPSISLIPLVHDNNDHALPSPRKRYEVPRPGIPFSPHRAISIARYPLTAVIFSVLFFVALLLLAVFIALFTSFTQAQESAAAAASGSPS
jgi:hypothetical protein